MTIHENSMKTKSGENTQTSKITFFILYKKNYSKKKKNKPFKFFFMYIMRIKCMYTVYVLSFMSHYLFDSSKERWVRIRRSILKRNHWNMPLLKKLKSLWSTLKKRLIEAFHYYK